MERSGAPLTGEAEGVPPVTAVAACAAMAAFYVSVLYSPTVVLRLPPPLSLESFLFRRFACAAVSSAVSVFLFSLLLPIRNLHGAMPFFSIYGVRADHMWQALVIPLLLTSLLYSSSLVSRIGSLYSARKEVGSYSISAENMKIITQKFVCWIRLLSCNVFAWRTYIVAPLTEEIVFRSCMIPLLLCGGFKTYKIIFFSPVFFSLAHLHHFWELHSLQRYSFAELLLLSSAWLHCDLWVVCFLSIDSNRAPDFSHCGSYAL
ncbi:CAAX prenyl protease 2 [Acorus calamus]|uniref:intramembrane prenyl-peptidase Rce1 n=1 Tax=Acorus calamus TaxID=4465 RepID=A0AAV9FEH8_ACOCL|nr:CAAX prenyl protease 2 [Acorus calamus]